VDKEFFVSKYTLIDFWASWCIPCRTKMKEIKSIFDATDKAKLQIVSISIDENKDNWTKAMHQDDITWKSYIDTKGWNGDIAKTFALTSIPRNILVDGSGTIVAIDIWDTQLRNFLKNKD
jgi:thiol-disulfide isomerase/thioredoxin